MEFETEIGIVIPAFNEQHRITPTLLSIAKYFDLRHTSYKILVVDDGSTDDTTAIVSELALEKPTLMLIKQDGNYGKGAAVKKGMLSLKAKHLLFCDADGSAPINEFERLIKAIHSGNDVAFGSRAIVAEDVKLSTSIHRKLIGRIFNFFINNILLPEIKDSQCGFKLFTYKAAQFIFQRQTAERFSFDVELLYIAKRAGLKTAEVAINWNNVAGSKVNVFLDGISMLMDTFRFKFVHKNIKKADWDTFFL